MREKYKNDGDTGETVRYSSGFSLCSLQLSLIYSNCRNYGVREQVYVYKLMD